MAMIRPRLADERGVALVVTIFALTVVTALVAGAFVLGTQEQRVGENQRRLGQSLGVAEAGAPELLRSWSTDSFNAMRAFPADTYDLGIRTTPARSGSYGGSVWKLNRSLYLLDITGLDHAAPAGTGALLPRGGGARQHVGTLVRIRPVQIPTAAALTTQGSVTMGGNAAVNGADQVPNATWTNCAAPDSAHAGIRTTPDGTVTGNGRNWSLTGAPALWPDPGLDSTTFTQFGDASWASLTSQARVVLAPGNYTTGPAVDAHGKCDRTVPTNWGDGITRTGPCGNYFSIIYVAGDVRLNNTQGQGILLVDGDLEIQGSYEWFGIVIVRGSLKTSGGGTSAAHFWGAVMARNVDLESSSLSGRATLNYSKCAIVEALEWTGVGAALRSRSFVALN